MSISLHNPIKMLGIWPHCPSVRQTINARQWISPDHPAHLSTLPPCSGCREHPINYRDDTHLSTFPFHWSLASVDVYLWKNRNRPGSRDLIFFPFDESLDPGNVDATLPLRTKSQGRQRWNNPRLLTPPDSLLRVDAVESKRVDYSVLY